MMVLPNKLPIVLSNDIAHHVVKLPEPEVSAMIVFTLYLPVNIMHYKTNENSFFFFFNALMVYKLHKNDIDIFLIT